MLRPWSQKVVQPWSHQSHRFPDANSDLKLSIAAINQEFESNFKYVVGHLPKEISWFTWFIIEYSAAVTLKDIDVTQKRCPLTRGGLEIQVEVIVLMPFLDFNKLALHV